MSKLLLFVAAVGLMASAPREVSDRAVFELLRRDDLRLAQIGERLAIANAPLCRRKQPWIGVVIHSLEQYQPSVREAARSAFGFASPLAIEAVVPGGPAHRVGIIKDDGLLAIADHPLPERMEQVSPSAATRSRDFANAQLAALSPSKPLVLRIRHAGVEREVSIVPHPGCRAQFEVHYIDEAAADGVIVQIGASFLDKLDDDWLAVVVAHELAHIILRHRERMEAAGVSYGLLAEFGKSGRLHARAEQEADQLSVYLLANAGYDPMLAARFWRGPGRQFDGGLLRSRIYPDRKERARVLEAEAAAIAGSALPVVPSLVALADQPMK